MLVCTLVPRNINIWNSLPESLVRCVTVQTFRRHLDRIDLSKLLLTNRVLALSVSVAAYCCFSFSICFWGKVSVSLGPSYPVANQLYCFCLCYFVLWFAANKFDLIWYDLINTVASSYTERAPTQSVITGPNSISCHTHRKYSFSTPCSPPPVVDEYWGCWWCRWNCDTAFRIHISSETKDKLDSLGGYRTQYRGEVELKVRIYCYWSVFWWFTGCKRSSLLRPVFKL